VKLVAAQVNYALSPGQVMVLAGQQWSEHQPDQVCLQPVTTIVKEELPQVDPDPQEGLPEKCDLRLEEYAGSACVELGRVVRLKRGRVQGGPFLQTSKRSGPRSTLTRMSCKWWLKK
jgi:hypothetical protein